MTTHYSFHIDPTDTIPAFHCEQTRDRCSFVVAPGTYVTGTPSEVIAWAEALIGVATEQAAKQGHLIVPVPDRPLTIHDAMRHLDQEDRWTTGDDGSWLP